MKLEIQGFDVAAVYCEDLQKSVRFYTEVLGFEKKADTGDGVQLQLPGEQGLSVYLQGGHPRDTRAYSVSKISLCFRTSSVKRTFQQSQTLDLPLCLDYKEVSENYAMFCVSDPSGNQIMFMGAP